MSEQEWYARVRPERWTLELQTRAEQAAGVVVAHDDPLGVRVPATSMTEALRVLHDALGIGPGDVESGHPVPV